MVAADGTVETQFTVVALDGGLVVVEDMEGAEGLEKLGVGTLHTELQTVGQGIVFLEEGFADAWYPYARPGIEVRVDRLARPQGDVVEVDGIVVDTTIDDGTQFAVADEQRLLEIVGWPIEPQTHRWLWLCKGT